MYLQQTKKALTQGGLFLIGTPIGNLEDVTLRAIDTLKNVDYILAEDTRVTQKLLNHFAIDKRLVSFHEHNQYEKAPKIIRDIQQGKKVGLVSDAGMPCISDPGSLLVKAVVDAGLPVTSVPGPSAGVTLFSLSGLAEQSQFLFHGFLPTKEKAKTSIFTQYLAIGIPIIFYESPHRILKTFATLTTVFPENTQVILGRELTKIHETFLWFTLGEFTEDSFAHLMTWKGEIVFIVSGESQQKTEFSEEALIEMMQVKISSGLKLKDAMKEVADKTGKKSNALYQLWQNKGKHSKK